MAQPPLRVAIVPVTPLQQNCSLIWCTTTMKAAVIDPGGDLPRIHDAIARAGVTVERILLTHGHIDHAGEAKPLADALGVPIEGSHAADLFWLDRLAEDGARYGIAGVPFVPDRWLVEGDTLAVGEQVFDVYETPGHTAGHVVFHHPASKLAIVGDTLFASSVGRTDMPQGDADQLVASITAKLWPLGDDTVVLPGHGPHTTIGYERKTNPFVGDAVLAR